MSAFRLCISYALVALSLLGTGIAVAEDVIAEGKKIFNQKAEPKCAMCHSLKHADSYAEGGPDLDELKPDAVRVEKAVRNGIGEMPVITGLTDAEIKLVARYLAEVAGKK